MNEAGTPIAAPPAAAGERVKLNVGGRKFVTTRDTLLKSKFPFFVRLLESPPDDEVDQDEKCYFIDRNGDLFVHVLDYLRNGVLHGDEDSRVRMELNYFGVLPSPLRREKEPDHEVLSFLSDAQRQWIRSAEVGSMLEINCFHRLVEDTSQPDPEKDKTISFVLNAYCYPDERLLASSLRRDKEETNTSVRALHWVFRLLRHHGWECDFNSPLSWPAVTTLYGTLRQWPSTLYFFSRVRGNDVEGTS